MELRTFVTFQTHFPDEERWKEGGQDLLSGPGFKTATELVRKLRQAGFNVSNPCERDYYGWEFSVAGGITFVIQHGGEEVPEGTESLLLLSDGSFLRRLFAARKLTSLHRGVLERINEFLQGDGRFHSIRWFTKEEFQRPLTGNPNAGHSAP